MNKKVVSVINQKGGVGKTTTVINLAAGLSMKGKKILIIDLDPQGNATTGLGLSNTTSSDQTIYNVLNGNKKISEVIQHTSFGNLDLISAISDLNSGNWNFNDYSNNIDVDTAGSYAYFLDRSGGSDSLGYDYQEVAGIDAKNGLVMFNLQSKNAL